MEFKIAKDDNEAADLWFARRNVSQSITIYGKKKLNETISPCLRFSPARAALERIGNFEKNMASKSLALGIRAMVMCM